MTTPTPAERLRQIETTAIRLLHDAYSVNQVAARTGLPEEHIRRLARDFPGGAGPRPDNGRRATPSELPVRILTEHPDNIRHHLEDLTELTDTVRAHGVVQPLLVARDIAGRYVVIDGHRRLAAAIAAGCDRVPVTVRGAIDLDEALELMLVTGLQKVALHPIDEANAYGRLVELGHKPTDIAAAVGKNPGHVSQRLALLNLSEAEQDAIRRGEVSVHDGYLTGRDRSQRRRPHDVKRPKPKNVPHFTDSHPLAAAARDRCQHDTLLKLGVACGPCWEQTIRDDAAEDLFRRANPALGVTATTAISRCS